MIYSHLLTLSICRLAKLLAMAKSNLVLTLKKLRYRGSNLLISSASIYLVLTNLPDNEYHFCQLDVRARAISVLNFPFGQR
jgi:hypothetical protein